MKRTTIVPTVLVTLVWIGCWGQAARAASAGTAFTYQGRLIDAESAADGLYDLTFRLYDANVGGAKAANDINVVNLDVIDGYFTLELDFGSVFDGHARWLEIGVRPGELEDPNAYTILQPRQEVTPVPYAMQTRGIFVDGDGSIGIATTSPLVRLDVRESRGTDTLWSLMKIKGRDTSGDWHSVDADFGATDVPGGRSLFIQSADNVTSGIAFRTRDSSGTDYRMVITNSGKVGIGTTTPAEKLEVLGDVKVAGTDHGVIFPDGSKLTSASSGNGGDSDWVISGNNMYSGPSGNVGIGTTSPTSKLEVAGMVHSTSEGFKFPDGTTQTTAATGGGGGNTLDQAYDQGGPGAGRIITADAGAVNIEGTSGLTVSGCLGIGTTSPAEMLQVEGNMKLSGAGNGVIFPDGSKQTSAASGNGGDSDWVISGNDMYSGPSGNVGIGTTSPAEKFEVLGNVKLSGTGNGVVFPDGSKQTTAASGGGPESDYGRSGVSTTLYEGITPLTDKYVNQSGDAMNGSNTDALLSVTNSAAGSCKAVYGLASNSASDVINYGGYFLARGEEGVGVYGEATGANACGVYGHAPTAGGDYTAGVYGRAVGLHGYGVQGEATSDAGAGVFGHCAGGKGVFGLSTYGDGVYGESGSYAGEYAAVRGVNTGVSGYAVYGRSNLGTGVRGYGGEYDFMAAGPGADYASFSSIRWKTNLRSIDEPLEKVERLRGVYFTWDQEHGGHHDVGMVAEEVGQVLPEIVQYEPDSEYATAMDYSKLTPLLTEAVKALKGQVDQLRNQQAERDSLIEALRQQNRNLEARLGAMESSIAKIAMQAGGTGK